MHVASFLDLKGLDVNDVSIFFTLLKLMAGKEDLDAEAFTTGCLRMRGVAKSIDLLTLSYQVQLFEKRLTQSLTRCSKKFKIFVKTLCSACLRIIAWQSKFYPNSTLLRLSSLHLYIIL